MRRNLFELLEKAVERFPHRPFLQQESKIVTFDKLWTLVKYRADDLKAQGFQPHHRFFLPEYNSKQLIVSMLATWKLGGVFVPFSPQSPHQSTVSNLVQPFGSISPIIEPPKGTPSDLSLILFTSGTTSTPKGVLLTHENIYSNLEMIDQRIPHTDINELDSSFAFLPWFHSYGLICEVLFLMNRGAKINIPTNPDPKIFFPEIRRANPSLLFSVPHFLQRIHQLSEQKLWHLPNFLKKKYLFGSEMRLMSVGGAKVDIDTLTFFNHSLKIPILQGYGMTETSPMISLCSFKDNINGSCGKPLNGIQYDFTNNGILKVRGTNISPGYLGENNTLRRHALHFDQDWFITGDRISLKDDYFFFEQRENGLWKLSNGKFVDPLHIEQSISKINTIEQVAIIGNHERFLRVVVYLSQSVDKKEFLLKIQNHLRMDGFEPHEIPKKIIILKRPMSVADGTLSIKLEPLRHRLQERYTFPFYS